MPRPGRIGSTWHRAAPARPTRCRANCSRCWPASISCMSPIAAPGPRCPISSADRCRFVAITSSIEYIKAGKLRALGVTTTTRSEALRDVPTIADSLPGYEDSNWWGFGAPKATSAAIIDKLNRETNAALADPKIKARLAELGGTVLAGSPADFGKLIADETEKWAKVIKFAGIKPE